MYRRAFQAISACALAVAVTGPWPAHAQTELNGGTVSVIGDGSFANGPPVIFIDTTTLAFGATGSPIDVTFDMSINPGVTGIMDTSDATFPVTLSGDISGDGALQKTGDGILALSGVNSFTGGTSVEAGILALIGNGSLVAGAQVDVAADATFAIGNDIDTSFSGTINLENQGSDPSYGMFAKTGAGTLTIDGATISGGEAYVVEGALAQTSGNSSITYLSVGTGIDSTSGNPNVGALDVSGGTLEIGTAMQVGDFGGQGTVNQTGGTVRLLPTCGDPSNCVALNIGNQGGTGIYNISGGTLELNGGTHNLGRSGGSNPASDGTLNISGTGLVVLRPAEDPDFGDGNLIIGSREQTSDGGGQGTGTINQTGGTLRIENGSEFYLSAFGDGTYNLSAGTLQIGGNSFLEHYGGGAATGTYEFNFGGGTIEVLDTALITSVDANLVADTISTIDTNGIGATFSGVFSGDGALRKTGDGTLVLSGVNTFTGGTAITEGTLQLGLGGSLAATGAVQVDAGATFDVNGNAQQIGALSGAGTVLAPVGSAGTGGLAAGDATNTAFSGTIDGNFAKIGTGTMTINNATFIGTTYIGQGAFAQTSGTTTADYLAVGEAGGGLPGVGILNVSGGTLNIGTAMQVGDFGGEGTVNQTGGTVQFVPTCSDPANCVSLNIGNQGGTGEYNISGGTLVQNGGFLNIGRNAGDNPQSQGTLNISGTGLVWVRPASDSAFGTGDLIIGSRSQADAPNDQGTGIINQTGGTLRIDNASEFYLSGYGEGTYNLSGGTLQIGGNSFLENYQGGAAYEFNFGGGTIEVLDTALTTSVDANLVSGTTSTIDTNGIGATWSGVLSGDGALRKTGGGTLTLTAINSYAGGTQIDGGTLAIGTDANLGASGGGLSFDGGTLQFLGDVFSSREVSLESGGGTFDTLANIVDLSGPIDGVGGLTKIGEGTLVLTGSSTYTGATRVNEGILQANAVDAFAPESAFTVASGAILDLNDLDQTIGSLAGSGDVQLGAGLLTTGGNNSSTSFSGVIDGEGGLTKIGSRTFTLAGDNTYTGPTTVVDGTLRVNGSIVSATTVQDGGTLGGTGTLGPVTVLSGGVYAPGSSIGTQTINGPFTLDPGAIFEVEANAAGEADRVIVNGTVNLSGAVLRVLAAGGNYQPSTEYLIVENDGTDAVQGEFAEISTNLAFLTPSVVYDGGTGNDVVLFLDRTFGPDGPRSFCDVAVTRNQCNVAHALELFPTDDPLFLAVLTQTAAGARQAFDALSGEIHATLPGVLADDSRYVREAVLGRLVQASYTNDAGQIAALGAGGPQVASLNTYDTQAMALGYGGKHLAPPSPSYGAAFWTRAYGAWGDFDGNNNAASADRDLGGFISGVDTSIGGSWRAGLAAGGAWSNVSVGDRRSNADIESFNLAGYIGGMAGPLALRGGGSWTWSEIDTSRAVVFPGFFERQESSYDADTGQIFGEIAYPTMAGRFAVEPFVGLAYVSIDTDGFRERGGALSALTGSSDDEDVGYSTLGLRAATVTHFSNMMVVPKISAAWQHAFDDVTPGASLAFASTGIGFGVTGVPLAEDSLLLEAGLDLALSPNATLGVSYTGQFADDVTDNGIKGRFSWLF